MNCAPRRLPSRPLLPVLLLLLTSLPAPGFSQELPPPTSEEETGVTRYLKDEFTCQTSGYDIPFAHFNGAQVLYFDQLQLTGRDPKTALVRWQEGELKSIRNVVDKGDRLLMIGEHIQMVEKDRGKRAWDFPLNCFSPSQCNADVLAVTRDMLLIGGFGTSYNMLIPVSIKDGSQLWPSWLKTCHMSSAGVVSDSIVLVCEPGVTLIQRIDLKSRRTIFSAPAPAPGFKAQHFWASEKFLFVSGLLDGKRKLYVFSTDDGKLVRTFNVKESGNGGEMGFRVSPEKGRFVPWQRKGEDILAWGMDVTTGKVAWKSRWKNSRIVGQEGATLIVLENAGNKTVLRGVDLASGDGLFSLDFPFANPLARLQAGRLLLADRVTGRFVVVNTTDGAILYLGETDRKFPATDDKVYFAEAGERFVLLVGTDVQLFSHNSMSSRAAEIEALLDDGEEEKAMLAYAALAPFASVIPAAGKAAEQILRFRWLKAGLALREGDYDVAVENARRSIAAALRNQEDGFAVWYPFIARFALQCALDGSTARMTAPFIFDTLETLCRHSDIAGISSGKNGRPGAIEYVDLVIALSQGLKGSLSSVKAFDLVRRMHGKAELKGYVESHPFWAMFQVEEVEATLQAADEAHMSGDNKLTAGLLHDLARVPVAVEIFGNDYDPWLDAQGVYLMPPELQSERLPELLKALQKKLARQREARIAESQVEVCVRGCELGSKHCVTDCIADDECEKSSKTCTDACRKGRRAWPLPDYIMEPGSDEFYFCR